MGAIPPKQCEEVAGNTGCPQHRCTNPALKYDPRMKVWTCNGHNGRRKRERA